MASYCICHTDTARYSTYGVPIYPVSQCTSVSPTLNVVYNLICSLMSSLIYVSNSDQHLKTVDGPDLSVDDHLTLSYNFKISKL